MPQLPLDLYVCILETLPAARLESDGGVSTLVNCLRTNTLLREAALVPSLWERHYRARYQHDEQINKPRPDTPDWRLMYAERRRRDNFALELLDQIVRQRQGRCRHAATLAALSFDVWDVLDIERSLPVPPVFGGNPTATIAYDALTRRFWASTILEAISRRFAVMQWGSLVDRDTSHAASFVDAFSSLSCFFGKPPQEIRSLLLELANSCYAYLTKHRCCLNPEMPEYNLPDICTKICQFMLDQNFGPVQSAQFYDISNHFPHKYLTTHRHSIPISLAHVFVSLARSIGVPASPVEFPVRVLVHVSSPPAADDFLVDVYGAQTRPILSLRNDIPAMLMRMGIPPDNLLHYVSPCGAAPMLLRAARNILSSFRNDASRSTTQASIYAAVCIHLLLTNETQLVSHMLSHLDLDPVYCATFLADFQPLLRPGSRNLLETACRATLESEDQQAVLVHRRTDDVHIAHYVGMVFEHRSYLYIGCIIGWEPTCLATEEWQTTMNVQNLARGANQPFYHILSLDGGQRYVAEDNINPIALTAKLALQFYQELPALAKYFSDANIHPVSGRGRWKLSPELQHAYPDDVEEIYVE